MKKLSKLLTTTYNLQPSSGFTLTELLVVIAMIAVLATGALMVVNPTEQTNRARDAQRQQNINLLAKQLVEYASANNGTYPPTANWSTLLVPASNNNNTFIRNFPAPLPGSIACTGVAPINYCYQNTANNVIVYTIIAAKSQNRLCTSPAKRHYYWQSSTETFNYVCKNPMAVLDPLLP